MTSADRRHSKRGARRSSHRADQSADRRHSKRGDRRHSKHAERRHSRKGDAKGKVIGHVTRPKGMFVYVDGAGNVRAFPPKRRGKH
jgi:hypothetical protein